MRPIGYYVHHQGAGHWQRACAVAARLARPCTVMGTVAPSPGEPPPRQLLSLPDDRLDARFSGGDAAPDRPLAFHYAPLGHSGVRRRMAAIARWAAEADPALLVVDVSVEVALLARLLSVPTLVVRLAGHRTDPAHLEAFRSAEALLAPFPAALDAADTPDWVRDKTLYAGLVGLNVPRDLPAPPEDGRVAVILGRGGEPRHLADLAAAAAAVPDRAWHVFGELEGVGDVRPPPNLHLHGWVADPAERIRQATVVVGSGGDGVVGLAASCAKRFVCLPEPRLYDEQRVKARALGRCGAAIVCDTWPTDWPDVIARASLLEPANIARLVRDDGIGWIAGQIDALAERCDLRRSERPVVG